MFRRGVLLVLAGALTGCATAQAPKPAPWEPRVAELERAQARLERRFDEMSRELVALRERLYAQEEAIQGLRRAEKERPPSPPEPRVKVVELGPPEKPTPPPTGAEPADTAAADLYRRAFNAYRNGSYAQAILDFEEFLQRYPDHEYADNAQYWIGEAFYSQGEYEQAIVEFQKVVDRYPDQPKAPDALLKIGLAYQRLGNEKNARAFWNRVVAVYPESEAASRARELLGAE